MCVCVLYVYEQTNWIWNLQAVVAYIRYSKRLKTNMGYVTGNLCFLDLFDKAL
jgi:hypothetical protein